MYAGLLMSHYVLINEIFELCALVGVIAFVRRITRT